VVGAGQLRDRLTRLSGAGVGAVGAVVGAVVGVLGVMRGLGEAKDRWTMEGGEKGGSIRSVRGGGSTVLYFRVLYRWLTGRVQGTPGPVTTRHNTMDHRLSICQMLYHPPSSI
jgi:hypothetical protein